MFVCGHARARATSTNAHTHTCPRWVQGDQSWKYRNEMRERARKIEREWVTGAYLLGTRHQRLPCAYIQTGCVHQCAIKVALNRLSQNLGTLTSSPLAAWCRGGQLGTIAMTVLRQPSGWRTRYTTDAVRDRDAARKHAGWGSARIHPSQGGPVAQARVFGLRHRGTSQGGGHMEDRRPLWFHAHGKPLRGGARAKDSAHTPRF